MKSMSWDQWRDALDDLMPLVESGNTLSLDSELTALAWGLRKFEGDEALVRAAIKGLAEVWTTWDADDLRRFIEGHQSTWYSFEKFAQSRKDELHPDFPEELMRRSLDRAGEDQGVDWEYFGRAVMVDSDLRVDAEDGRVVFFTNPEYLR